MTRTYLLLGAALATACGTPPRAPHDAPASVAAVQRLAIETALVEEHDAPPSRTLGGEVVIPPGRVLSITAPVAGAVRLRAAMLPGTRVHAGEVLLRLVPLAPTDRDTRARAVREVEATRAALAGAEARLNRTQALAQGRAGSVRATEEATAARDIALADVEAAQARLRATASSPLLSDVSMTVRAPEDGVVRALTVASGQTVAAGAALAELVAVDQLWVRAPVDSGDLHQLVPAGAAMVAPLGARATEERSRARFIAGPPTASPSTGTVDRYYALDDGAPNFSPGQRVIMTLPLRANEHVRAVPYSAVLYDAHGSEWLYVQEGAGLYRRVRTEVLRRAGELAILGRGPAVGTRVVSVGAAEVFGAEFEPGH